MAAGVTDKLWEIGDIITMVEAWEAEYATAGITYRIGENEIGEGFFVRVIPRYEPVPDPVYGFKSREEAETWIAAEGSQRKARCASVIRSLRKQNRRRLFCPRHDCQHGAGTDLRNCEIIDR